MRPATEPPAWVAPYDYGKEAGRGERFNTTAEKAIALGSSQYRLFSQTFSHHPLCYFVALSLGFHPTAGFVAWVSPNRR
ncbi:hypothetical protein [Limnospira maxima]|uniref:hypothetical protein n=1 Tax=Limnospira sp. TaxID=3100384 RepID=UPI00178C2CB5